MTARIFDRTGATCATTELTADRTGGISAATTVTCAETAAIYETTFAVETTEMPVVIAGTSAATSVI